MKTVLLSPSFIRMFAFIVLYYIFLAWCISTIAKKQGQANTWFAWIPILNIYMLGKIAGYGGGMIFLLFVPLINFIVAIHAFYKITIRMSRPGWTVLLMFLPVINLFQLYYISAGEYAGHPVNRPLSKSRSAKSTLVNEACPNCGEAIDSKDQYCGECGAFLGNLGTQAQEDKSGSTLGGLIAAVLVILVIAAAGYYGFKFFKNTSQSFSDLTTNQKEAGMPGQFPEENNPGLQNSQTDNFDTYSNRNEDQRNNTYQEEVANNPNELLYEGDSTPIETDNSRNNMEEVTQRILEYEEGEVPQELLDELEKEIQEEENSNRRIFSLSAPTLEEDEDTKFDSNYDKVYTTVEQPPLFGNSRDKASSDMKLEQFIKANIVYPQSVRTGEISGIVYMSFIVEKDGSISDVYTLRSLNNECDDAAHKAVLKTKDVGWTAGRQGGQAVRVQYTLPVHFEL